MKLLVILCFINVVLSDYKFTQEIISKCQKYVSDNGYNYKNYFKVHNGHLSPGIKFELHLAIKAKNNGHILLSSTDSVTMSDPVYEFTIGAGGNTFTELRRMRMKEGKSTADTINILKDDEYTPFWIKAHDDGLIEFGREGEDASLVSYHDPFPLRINYFSFTSWRGIKATFLYDCPSPDNITTSESEEVEKILSTTERLRKDLMTNYDASISPALYSSASIRLVLEYHLQSLSLDVKKSVLRTHGTLLAQWVDENLRWDPSDYENITTQTFNSMQIWTPEIKVYDSLDMNYVNWSNLPIFCNNDGTLSMTTSFVSRTWCSSEDNIIMWPRDVHVCVLRLGSWSQHSQIDITSDELKDVPIFAFRDEFYSNEWNLHTMVTTGEWTNYSPYVQMFENMDSDLNTLNTLNIEISFERIDATYISTLYTPFVCIVLIVVLTFWISTTPTIKITILCIELLFVMAFTVQVLDEIPPYARNVPHIVLYYFWAIIVLWMSIIVNALTIKITSDPQPWMYKARKFLTTHRISTCLTFSNIKVDKSYESHDADKCDGDEEEEDEIEWRAFGAAIDRVVFAVFTVVFGLYRCYR